MEENWAKFPEGMDKNDWAVFFNIGEKKKHK